ncbi:MAG: Na(+)/H(+) antiporter subunit D [Verrucomicrobiae bacterium]|nr:Na(+)/H(+) antiporter subunit D [Verrucomicrobiae bacterium]
MNLFADFPPFLILFIGALFVPLFRGHWRSAWVILLPCLAFLNICLLPTPAEGQATLSWSVKFFPWLNDSLSLLRVDRLAKAFGFIFTLNAVAAFVFAFYVKKSTQHIAALVYIGSALGAVFAGDLLSLYVFWEIMAVSSTFVILARKTEKAKGAAFRYVMIHLFGGLFFLAGLVLTIHQTGSIAFNGFDFSTQQNLGTWLLLIGILVNAGAPPLSAWLSDAYPEASVTGGVILSAYTTKTAVYVLLRGFDGWDPLIWIGCLMSIYGIVYALLENDMRRILAYSIINQVGFMVAAAGIGGPIAISGATAHAFCHIIYKSLLWMSAGAVLYRVGRSKCTELGGLYKTMPWTLIFGTIGALAISAVPLTSGFTSKTIILHAAELGAEHRSWLFWPWLILEAASAGVFLHAGIKFPYFVFFNVDRGLRPKEAPKSMLAAMGFLAFLCLFLGIYPAPLYAILPYHVDYTAWTVSHVVTQMQLLMLSALVFFLFLPLLKRTSTISLDTDWFYRKGGKLFYDLMDRSLNGINAVVGRVVNGCAVPAIVRFFAHGPSYLATTAMMPVWKMQGHDADEIARRKAVVYTRCEQGAFPIGITACLAVLLLALLFVVSYLSHTDHVHGNR